LLAVRPAVPSLVPLHGPHQEARCVRGSRARDLDNVAMAACVFGCDALFEAEYVAVSPEGLVLTALAGDSHPGLVDRLASLYARRVRTYRREREVLRLAPRQHLSSVMDRNPLNPAELR
jgi:hypothetical protein